MSLNMVVMIIFALMLTVMPCSLALANPAINAPTKASPKVKKNKPRTSEKIQGDTMSEEQNELMESASVPNPKLSEMIGFDGKPLSEKPQDSKQIEPQQ